MIQVLAQIPGQSQGPPLQPLPHPEMPAVPPVAPEVAFWVWFIGGLVLAVFLGMVVWFLFKSRPAAKPPRANPRAQTLRALRQLHGITATLPPPEVGHRVSVLLRQYLQERYKIPATARTTPELFSTTANADTPRLRSAGLLEVHPVRNTAPTGVVAPFAPLAELWDRLAFAPMPATTSEALALVDAALNRIEEDPA